MKINEKVVGARLLRMYDNNKKNICKNDIKVKNSRKLELREIWKLF